MPFTPFDLTGKVALVTGASSGIGLGMADALARAGAGVVVWDRDTSRREEVHAKLSAHGTPIDVVDLDVSVEADVASAVQAAVERFGRIDAVFANAAISRTVPFLEMTTADYRAVLATNLDGALWTLREVARHMVARAVAGDPGGTLVATSSLAALEGAPGNEAYAAAKGGLLSVIRALAVQFARYEVRAHSILPGWTMTGMSGQHPGAFDSVINTRVPLRRWGTPDDFGGLAVYLASPASAFHTGGTFVIDGGYSIF